MPRFIQRVYFPLRLVAMLATLAVWPVAAGISAKRDWHSDRERSAVLLGFAIFGFAMIVWALLRPIPLTNPWLQLANFTHALVYFTAGAAPAFGFICETNLL